jgi:hypothetical protein
MCTLTGVDCVDESRLAVDERGMAGLYSAMSLPSS